MEYLVQLTIDWMKTIQVDRMGKCEMDIATNEI